VNKTLPDGNSDLFRFFNGFIELLMDQTAYTILTLAK